MVKLAVGIADVAKIKKIVVAKIWLAKLLTNQTITPQQAVGLL